MRGRTAELDELIELPEELTKIISGSASRRSGRTSWDDRTVHTSVSHR